MEKQSELTTDSKVDSTKLSFAFDIQSETAIIIDQDSNCKQIWLVSIDFKISCSVLFFYFSYFLTCLKEKRIECSQFWVIFVEWLATINWWTGLPSEVCFCKHDERTSVCCFWDIHWFTINSISDWGEILPIIWERKREKEELFWRNDYEVWNWWFLVL